MEVRLLRMPEDPPALERFLAHNREMGQLSENKVSRMDIDGGRRARGVIGERHGELVAFAALAPAASPEEWAMEVVAVAGTDDLSSLVEVATTQVRENGARRLRWWVYDNMRLPDPTTLGFDPERRLLRMGRSLPADRDPAFPSGIRVSGFTAGEDESTWLAANNAAFAGHPENGDLTLEDLETRMAMDWFEPEGLRMAWEGETLTGFCWTKIHPGGEGEIYIIGVVPSFQGRGLGRELVLEGMRHLSGRGCETVMLYTEGDNAAAVGLYENLGMRTEAVNLSFVKSLA